MPIYEYQCSQCGHQLEILQAMSDSPLSICPHCQATALTKLISNTTFQLKGTGWYKTDYATKPKAAETNNPDAKNTTPPATEATKSEANESKTASPKETGTKAE